MGACVVGILPSGVDRQEIEWQYDAPDGLKKVEGWLLGDPERFGLTVLKNLSKELVDTYYDTGDWRLYHAGYALRVRREGVGDSEATMKSLVPADGNLHRRREISEPLEGDEVETLFAAPGPVGVCLRALADAREMRRIFEVRTSRRTFDLVSDGQATDPKKALTSFAVRVGEVALDHSEIPLGASNKPARLTRVEVELDTSASGAYSKLEGFVKAMEEALGLLPATTSKYEAGLSATGQSPNSKAKEDKDPEKG